jgi:hypothetical protein
MTAAAGGFTGTPTPHPLVSNQKAHGYAASDINGLVVKRQARGRPG